MEKITTQGYIPAYTRTNLTDSLHAVFAFRTDFEITSGKKQKNLKDIKK
ncbi:MAG: hypothetical protein RSD14_02910 [Clostridia bacterium]